MSAHLWPVTETSARCLVLVFAAAVRLVRPNRDAQAGGRPSR